MNAQDTTTSSSLTDKPPQLRTKLFKGKLGIANVLEKFKHGLNETKIWSITVLAQDINDAWYPPSYPMSLNPNTYYSYYCKSGYIYITSLNISSSGHIALQPYRVTITYET